MRSMMRRWMGVVGAVGCASMFAVAAHGQSVVPLTMNALNVNATNAFGFGRFTYTQGTGEYAPVSVTIGSLGRAGSFVFDNVDAGGGGVGWNVTDNNASPYDFLEDAPVLDVTAVDFPILDRGGFGTNFNADEYRLEVVYRPLQENTADGFNITIDRHNGFFEDGGIGKRRAEQQQWQFLDIVNYWDENKGADDFATMSVPLSDGMGGPSPARSFFGQSHLIADDAIPGGGFQTNHTLLGAGIPDFDNFAGMIPNGVVQLHLQSQWSSTTRLQVELQRVSIVRINPDPTEVARMDAMSGYGRRFGTPFSTQTSPDGVTGIDNPIVHQGETLVIRPTDQIQRFDENGFTNLIIKTDDDDTQGGFGIWQEPSVQTFDGTQASLEVRAKLNSPLGEGVANQFDVVLNDLDGNDEAAGMGGEEYKYYIDLNNFNTSTFTTLTVPLTEFDERNQAFEFSFDGDESLEDFNLYYLGVLSLPDIGLLDLELEYIRVSVPEPPGLDGDFNGDGFVDAADYTRWRDMGGTPEQFDEWKGNFGAGQGAGSAVLSSAAAVPEPNAGALGLLATLALGWLRRRAG